MPNYKGKAKKHEFGKIGKPDSGKLRLFVYGTLRREGVAASYLEGQRMLKQNFRLPGFAMYDAGWYPFVVPAGADSVITGDVYEVDQSLVPILNTYEGEGYVAHFLEKENVLLYLKADEQTDGFVQVDSGDWISYWNTRKQ